jgi:glyoxylase-like metal-dependent hydrolase (beta-lactamase superfamily II)
MSRRFAGSRRQCSVAVPANGSIAREAAMFNRREFSSALALAAAGGVALPNALLARAQQDTVFDWRPINDLMRVAFGAGGNVLVMREGGRSLLVDTKNAGFGAVLRAEAEAFGGPLSHVVLTHHHGDHIGGTPAFRPDVPVVGQTRGVARATEGGNGTLEAVRSDPAGRLERLERQVQSMGLSEEARRAGTEAVAGFVARAAQMEGSEFAATETFDDAREVRLGTFVVELRHIDRGHTDNDLFVLIPAANVLHGGDLFFNGLHPFIDTSAGATTVGWQRCLAAMVEQCDADTVVIPGHGEISDVNGLRAFSGYFDTLRRLVEQAIRDGRTREQVTALQPVEFSDWPAARLNQNLGVVYDELTAR